MSLYRNARTLLTTPGMMRAYAAWLLSRSRGRTGPYIVVAGGYRLGEARWVSFSEYWSYAGGEFGYTPTNALNPSVGALLRRCRPRRCGRVAVDVGANVGIFTLEFAGLGFGEVHAFEPVPDTFSRLVDNVTANGLSNGVRANCVALGDCEGTIRMRHDSRSPATSFACKDGDLEVACTTLDRYAKETGLERIDLLKIDVEGYEAHVLRGASVLLRERRIGVIILEWAPALLRRAGSSAEVLHSILGGNGYWLYCLGQGGETGRIAEVAELDGVGWDNVVACPSGVPPWAVRSEPQRGNQTEVAEK